VGKTVKKMLLSSMFFHRPIRSNYFLHCFSTDQSEAESRHGVIIVAFEAITEIVEMHLHGPAQKNNRKPHLKKQNFMFNKKRTTFSHSFIFS
jgi:hypothetical protein